MTLCIRTAVQDDVVACVDILRGWAAETPWLPELTAREPMQDFWREMFDSQLSWVAEADGRILGFCCRGDDTIIGLYVRADARGTGVGKGLLDMAKTQRDWITAWVDEENLRALSFYRREGLVEVSREIEDWSGLVIIEHRWTRSG